jgi:Ca-activated chloride channel family protein
MLVDVSGSMGERDFVWDGEAVSRLDAVKRVFRLFVEGGKSGERTAGGIVPTAFEGRPTDEIAMVTFATRPETICPLTLSHSAMLHMLDDEWPRSVPGESTTNLSDAITLGLDRLVDRRRAQRRPTEFHLDAAPGRPGRGQLADSVVHHRRRQ